MLTHMLRAAAGNSTPAPTGPYVWRSSGAFVQSYQQGYSLGTAAAAWSGGGTTGTVSQVGANFNGTTWSSNANQISSARGQGANAGTYSAGIIAAGFTTAVVGTAQTFNGTAFTTITSCTARQNCMGCGTQSSALVFGGLITGTVQTTTELWNGSAWSTGGAMTAGKAEGQGAGTSSDAYSAAGRDSGGFANAGSLKYNGSSWSASTSLPTARARGFGIGPSTTDVLVVGGFNTGNSVSTTQSYAFNGTTWSTTYGLQTTRYFPAGSGGTSNSTSGIVCGGILNQNNVTYSSSTEIMAIQSTITGGVWGGYGYPSLGRIQTCGFGSTSAAVIASGSISPSAATSTTCEKSNGISWASTGAIGSEVQWAAGAGTASAGGVMLGLTGGSPTATFKSFNGTTWSVGGSNSVALSRVGGFGQSSSACGTSTGYTAGGAQTNATYLYNGTAWSTSGVAPNSLYYAAGSGTQTDAVLDGGMNNLNVQQTAAYTFNGTSWSTTGSMTVARDRHISFGASSSNVVASAGQTATLSATSKFTGSSWASVGTQIAQRWSQPGSSNSGTSGVCVGGYVGSSTTIYQFGSEQYYN